MTETPARRLDEKLGLSRVEAADRVGLGTTLFDTLVSEGLMPQPKEIKGRIVWDREDVDVAFKALPNRQPKPTAPADAGQGAPAPANPWNRNRTQAA